MKFYPFPAQVHQSNLFQPFDAKCVQFVAFKPPAYNRRFSMFRLHQIASQLMLNVFGLKYLYVASAFKNRLK